MVLVLEPALDEDVRFLAYLADLRLPQSRSYCAK